MRVTGWLRIDANAIKAEEGLDGEYLLRTSDPHLSPEDIALGCKRNSCRSGAAGVTSSRSSTCVRPATARKNASAPPVILCWLALLLARIAENACHATWPRSAASSTAFTSAPSPARPGPSGNIPRSPSPSAASSPSSLSSRRRGSPAHPRAPQTSANTLS